jgi:hypothetical protein
MELLCRSRASALGSGSFVRTRSLAIEPPTALSFAVCALRNRCASSSVAFVVSDTLQRNAWRQRNESRLESFSGAEPKPGPGSRLGARVTGTKSDAGQSGTRKLASFALAHGVRRHRARLIEHESLMHRLRPRAECDGSPSRSKPGARARKEDGNILRAQSTAHAAFSRPPYDPDDPPACANLLPARALYLRRFRLIVHRKIR